MKSLINRLADYREVPFAHEVVLACPQEHLQKELRHVVRPYKRTEKVKVIAAGDVAVLKLSSELPKFNRSMVSVTVGGGLYDVSLEEQLTGHSVGETFEAKVDGQVVQVAILQTVRTIFPEPTDEMVAVYTSDKEDFAGITTVAAYRDKVVRDYLSQERHEAVYRVMQNILDHILTNSDWEFDEDELEALRQSELEHERKSMWENEGVDFDAMTDEEIMRHYGIPTRARLEEIITQGMEQRVAMILWSAVCRGKDPKTVSFEDKDAMEFTFLEEYVRENLTIKEER